MKITKNTLKTYLIVAGLAANLLILYMTAGGPIFIDRWLDVTGPPVKAAFIICPTAGLTVNNLPTDAGWQCIYMAVQLYLDGFGDRIIFTGGGVKEISEAEIYVQAAGWLGYREEAGGIEPDAANTAEHPRKLLQACELGINKATAINIVSSVSHSRRLALCFRKAGFNNFHIVSEYMAQTKPSLVRERLVSRFNSYRPDLKSNDDVFIRLRRQNSKLFEALREVAAIAFYKLNGNG